MSDLPVVPAGIDAALLADLMRRAARDVEVNAPIEVEGGGYASSEVDGWRVVVDRWGRECRVEIFPPHDPTLDVPVVVDLDARRARRNAG